MELCGYRLSENILQSSYLFVSFWLPMHMNESVGFSLAMMFIATNAYSWQAQLLPKMKTQPKMIFTKNHYQVTNVIVPMNGLNYFICAMNH